MISRGQVAWWPDGLAISGDRGCLLVEVLGKASSLPLAMLYAMVTGGWVSLTQGRELKLRVLLI